MPFALFKGQYLPRYFQHVAIEKTLDAIAAKQDRILLTMATGTGKTATAFHICWKLFQTRWNLKRNGKRSPRILFLADRNLLADQAFNAFGEFDDDAKSELGTIPNIRETFIGFQKHLYYAEAS